MNDLKSIIFALLVNFGFFHMHALPLTTKVYVAGHNGLVGRALMRKLKSEGYINIITRSSKELDLTDQQQVNTFFKEEKPEVVFLAASKVCGIKANWDYQADAIYKNLMIQCNVLHAAYIYGVKKLLFLGSSCIYPKKCTQPIREEYLLTSELEKTNESYALAKISGLHMCKAYNFQYGTNFIACMPTNLYGPYDNFNLQTSHVLPALLAKFIQAKETNAAVVEVWGSGNAKREFLYVDDLADACLFLMRHYDGKEIVNVGVGKDISIKDLACLIKDIVGYKGKIVWDSTKPDGTPRKLLDMNKMKRMGWQATTSLREGVKKTITWFNENGGLGLTKKRK